MENIVAIENQFESGEVTDPGAVLRGYYEAKRLDLDMIVLSDYDVDKNNVPAIVESLKNHGIEKVGLVTGSSALRDILWAFTEAGATFTMELVDTGSDNHWIPRFEPGFVITLN